MNMPNLLVTVTTLIACVHDIRERRIPNRLTFSSAMLGIGYHVTVGGWHGLQFGLFGWVLGIALFLPFFLLRGMGGGDVKLLAALGAWLGPITLLTVTFYTAMAGGIMALAIVIWRKQLLRTGQNLWLLLCHWRAAGLRPVFELSLENKNAPRLAYALPIAAGAMLTIWLH